MIRDIIWTLLIWFSLIELHFIYLTLRDIVKQLKILIEEG
jgi:hypothetical protein